MLTRKRNLRTGTPVWASYRVPRIPFSPLERDEKADVLIIGAGITGAMTAQELTELGLSVILIDRHKPLTGSTFASTALLQYELDTPLTHLKRKIGTDQAVRAWRRSKLGLESLSAKIQRLDIRCDARRSDTLYLSGNLLDPEALALEQSARKQIGIETEYLRQGVLKERYHLPRRAALHSFDCFTANPVCLAGGFLKEALQHGARIYSPVNAVDLETSRQQVTVQTDTGHLITARHVVFAGGYEFPEQVKTKYHTLHSTWAIATKAQPGNIYKDYPMVWEASDPYLYFRTTRDGRIICGGEDENFADAQKRDAMLARKTAILERKLQKLFPDVDTAAEFAWTGSFGSSTTGLPMIGTVPDLPRCFVIMAFGGNGITFSRIAAEIIRAELDGKSDPDADLFRFRS